MTIDFNRYYIWGCEIDGINQPKNLLKDLPSKAVIFAPEEFEMFPGWGTGLVPENIDLTIVLGSANDSYISTSKTIPKTAKICLWPTYWFNFTYYEFKNNYQHFSQLTEITNLYISLNNKAHKHRCMMMDELCRRNLLEYGEISWHEPEKHYDWKYWKPELLILDQKYHETLDSYVTMPPEYGSTLINLVAESTLDATFITEKTCTAIMFNKPFIVFGGMGFHQELLNLGFELYDELFDYSFDNIEDPKIRLDKIISNIENLKDQDYNYLRELTRSKAERNRARMIYIATTSAYVPEFMKTYIATIKDNPDQAIIRDHWYLELSKMLVR